MTLADAEFDRSVRVLRFDALGEAEQTRLSTHGLRAGADVVKLLKLPLRDPIECLVGPQLLAIDSWLLKRIVVEPTPAQP